jgi:hypothetical protein
MQVQIERAESKYILTLTGIELRMLRMALFKTIRDNQYYYSSPELAEELNTELHKIDIQ